MPEYVSKGQVYEVLKYKGGAGTMVGALLLAQRNAVKELPAADVEPVRHGRWVDRYGGKHANSLYVCSECKKKALYDFTRDELGHEHVVQVLSAACPHCRAKMDVTDINVGNKEGGAE